MYRSLAAAATATLALFLASCSAAPTETMAPASPAPAPASSSAPAETMAPASPAAAADIVDTAVAAGDFETLTAAVTAAGLVETLKGPGPFTVFAPTDDAFAKLPEGTVESLLEQPEGELTQILTYHVIAGEVMAADVLAMDGEKVTTVQGNELTIEVSDGKVALVDAAGGKVNVIATDVDASNGVIHVIDGVLLPSA